MPKSIHKWIKKYLFAHKGNNYMPHLLRDSGIAFVFVLILGSFALSAGGHYVLTRTKLTSLVLSGVLVDFANQDRAEENFSHLVVSPILEKAAQLKANDMAEMGYFAHTSPEGKTPWYWFREAGYSFTYAGENLAVNFNESAEVNNAWMNSPGHRANIMNEKFTEIGIATAQGLYQGRPTLFVVQLFGKPKSASNAVVSNTKSTATVVTTLNTKPSEPKVLSESVSNIDEGGNSELFVSVSDSDVVEGTTTPVVRVSYSNYFQRVISSPEKYLGIFYAIITFTLMISLFSLLFIEIKKEHNRMIIFSIALICIMFALLYYFKAAIFSQLVIL